MTRTILATLTALLLFGSPTRADEIDDLVAQVSLANLQGHVATLAVTPRDSDQSQAAAADYIAGQLESYGYTVFRNPVAGDFGLGTSENIIAQLPGTETPERVFIVGAHFDSVQSSPGADDNASGVAGLLEIARVLAGSSFASSIELVAFAHEEIGLLGGQQHATATWAAGREVIGMISLEMIGYTCFTPGCAVIFPDLLPCFDVQGSIPSVLGDWIGVVANADHASLGQLFFDTGARYVPSLLVGWATVLGNGSCFPATRRSDHAPFWDYGYPALLVTDTADFRNPNYHGAGDVFATLDFSFAQQVTQAALATAATSASPADELGPTSIEVSKTASFDGRYVSGTISITNTGENPALLSAMADSLEVHFPRKAKAAPPPLPEGSVPNWFKAADVPVENPGLIPVGEMASIDYSFDLCAAADFTGANSMRNVIAVTLANKPEKARKDTVVTRSDSFEPQTPDCPVGTVTEDLSPCFVYDTWDFEVTAGQTVFLEADTLDAETAADLCFFGFCGGTSFFFGDDDFACTFPPPAFSCPQDTFVTAASGTCNVQVQTCSGACADPGMANYSLTVELDGVGAPLTLTGDDIGAPPQPSCHDLCVMGDPLLPSCDPCAEAICAVDPYCCDVAWDELCVDEVSTVCGGTCPGLLLDSSQATERLQTKADVCGGRSER